MAFDSWRGTVGVIKPTFRPGSLEEFIKLLPDGFGVGSVPAAGVVAGAGGGSDLDEHAAADVARSSANATMNSVIDADSQTWLNLPCASNRPNRKMPSVASP